MKKVIILLIILIFIFIIVFSFLFFKESSTIKYILKANENQPEFIDTTSYITKKDSSFAVKKDSLLPSKQNALLYEESANKINYSYYIIVGSFSKKTNAIRFQNMLIEKGMNASLIRSDFELYKVSVFSSIDKTIALDSLMKIKSIKEFNAAWLLKRRRLTAI
ncbi:MAG: SPOR domain-containing protein [Chlorobi bacterium]|nr:SPOR domain-containing protein [Chlorobiota bacterium]